MTTVTLLTCAAYAQGTSDDQVLARALSAHARVGKVEFAVWDSIATSSTSTVMIRSLWDYCEQHDVLLAWLRTMHDTRLLNPASVCAWNSHKSYLLDLSERFGLPVVPSLLFVGGESTAKAVLAAAKSHGWSRCIVKPAVGSHGGGVVQLPDTSSKPSVRVLKKLDMQLASKDMLLQPYIASVQHRGEVSLVFLRGELVVAVLKTPPRGDFKVQNGSVKVLDEVPAGALELAHRTLTACCQASGAEPSDQYYVAKYQGKSKKKHKQQDGVDLALVADVLLYARVDVLFGDEDELLVSEVEIFEPELFFRFWPQDAMDALCSDLAGSPTETE